MKKRKSKTNVVVTQQACAVVNPRSNSRSLLDPSFVISFTQRDTAAMRPRVLLDPVNRAILQVQVHLFMLCAIQFSPLQRNMLNSTLAKQDSTTFLRLCTYRRNVIHSSEVYAQEKSYWLPLLLCGILTEWEPRSFLGSRAIRGIELQLPPIFTLGVTRKTVSSESGSQKLHVRVWILSPCL